MNTFSELSVSGHVTTPGSADWDEARAAWNLAADQHPEAVVFAREATDVVAAVDFAAARGLRVSVQGTGHGAGPLPSLEGAVLVRTDQMRSIAVDAEARTARVEAGVLSAELGEAAHGHGLSAAPGSSPDVGVVGYTLGGGLGWLGRRHGFACNRVAAIELVTAAGEQLTVDAEREPDLFWALRGGGGGFAAVTALHVELVPIAEVYAGIIILPAALGPEALATYRAWAAAIGEDVTSIFRFLTPPDIPDVAPPLRGTPVLTIDAACIGDRAAGESAIAPLRAIGEPILDSFEMIPTSGLTRVHMDPEQPVPGIGDGMTLASLPDDAAEAFLGVAGPESGSPLLFSELRHLGGALGHAPEGAGALAKLDAEFVMTSIGMPVNPEVATAIGAHLDRIGEAMGPWKAAGAYINFNERPLPFEEIFPADVCARLREAKRKWDPNGVFVGRRGSPSV